MLILLFVSIATQAIVIRHDKADSKYRVHERAYPQIFFLHSRLGNKICVATVISPVWAITAAHCTEQTPIKQVLDRSEHYPLSIAGKIYNIDGIVTHPDYKHGIQSQSVDLALLHLDKEVTGIKPVQLYTGADEEGRKISILGWGYTGIGTTGRQGNDGKFRRAENTVKKAGQWLEFEFNDPRQTGSNTLPLEGVPGLGDSGGPALFESETGLKIVGVALGEIATSNPQQGRYGAIELYERISSHVAWINQVLAE